MPLLHIALAVLVMALWGFNFVMIHIGLQDVSPFLLCFLRFFFASMPLIFFMKRPTAPFKMILVYGLVTFALQYTLLFIGMRLGMPAGLAALLYQTQVFFTILLGSFFFMDKPSVSQIAGILIAFMGIGIVALHLGGNVTLFGFLLTIAAALVWAVGNIASKKIGKVNMLSLVVWGNFVSWPPLLILTFALEGAPSILQNLQHLSWISILAVFYIAYISTVFCFSVWSWLLHRYPVSTVAPFTLLVPIFAMLSSYFVSHEPLHAWKIGAAVFIIGGLIINLVGTRLLISFRHISAFKK